MDVLIVVSLSNTACLSLFLSNPLRILEEKSLGPLMSLVYPLREAKLISEIPIKIPQIIPNIAIVTVTPALRDNK